MKRILSLFPFLSVFLASSQLFASTSVGSTLSTDTQWDQSGSPYVIQGSVLVPPGVTLKIEPGVQVVFQGPATLQISGELKVEGSAAAPSVINMTDGGLQSAFWINGGDAQLSNIKVLGGVFLVQDGSIQMDASEVTKGSGLYLKGGATARLKNNKFYGNATGVVLDGSVTAEMRFNTLVQNTYGLYLKDFTKLDFVNNSIHDNDSEVVNNTSKVKLGGNYWGTLSPQAAKDKIKGSVSISPMRDLKDILRAYLRSELPVITKAMSDQAEAEDERTAKAAKLALKEFKREQNQAEIRQMEENNKKLTLTPTPVEGTPTMAPMFDISAPAVVPTATGPFSAVPQPDMSGTTALSNSAISLPPDMATATPSPNSAIPQPPDLTAGVPMPPSLSGTASEPPALGQLAAVVTPSEASELGGTPTTSQDLVSIVATAQEASSEATAAESPSPTSIVPTVSLPDSSSDQVSTDTPTASFTDTPVNTATFTSTPSATPTDTFTPIFTDTATLTFTSVPVVLTPTFTPSPAAAVSKDAVPPPPDLGDGSNATGVQPPVVPVSNAPAPAPAAPALSAAPPADLDVDGMQAPPMDSGLDYTAPKK